MTSLFLPAPIRRNAKTAANNSSPNPQQLQQPTTTQSQRQDLITSFHDDDNNNNNNSNSNINHNVHHDNHKSTITTNRAPTYEQRCHAATEFAKLTPAQRQSQNNNTKKKLFVPRSILDFDDGGAFPEIHVAQYPKHMGNPHLSSFHKSMVKTDGNTKTDKRSNHHHHLDVVASSLSTTKALANVQMDASGKKDYTSLIKGGTNAQRKVYAHHSDLKGYKPTVEEIALPTPQQEAETASRTQAAIHALLSDKIALSKPSGTALQNAATSMNQEEKTQFIEYTANPNAPGYNPTASKRVIQMVPAQMDPMMPPKHKHTKAPPGPAEDFVPVLHAPPEKLSKEERMAWNIPACISNWKNARGYTIPLDKRLAADGRGLRDDDSMINSNFATLSESLYLAERQAREEVRLRSLVQKRQAESERERRERELRELAMKARMDRSGGGVVVVEGRVGGNVGHDEYVEDDEYDEQDESEVVVPMDNIVERSNHGRDDQHDNDDDDDDDYRNNHDTHANIIEDEESRLEAEKRERIRQARRKERERELRMEKYKPKRGIEQEQEGEEQEEEEVAIKKARLGDRDISEKIALGVHTGSGGGLGGGIDSRLYNQNAGLDSGFGADDEYNTYTKPMFDREGVTSSSIYRPTRGEAAMDADEQYAKLKAGVTSRFQPDKGFSGAEGGGRGAIASGPRNAPVQFEKGETK